MFLEVIIWLSLYSTRARQSFGIRQNNFGIKFLRYYTTKPDDIYLEDKGNRDLW
jgi:hypothetical protein